MPLTLTIKNEHELQTFYDPNHRINVAFVVAGAVVAVSLFALVDLNATAKFAIWGVSFLLFAFLVSARERRCVIDLNERTVWLEQAGVLNSSLGKSEQKGNLAALTEIQIVRHVNRGLSTFAIRLEFEGAKRLPITGADLGFATCQKYSSEIQKFIGTHIPIVAVG